jgi:hypothetical protein
MRGKVWLLMAGVGTRRSIHSVRIRVRDDGSSFLVGQKRLLPPDEDEWG